MEAGRATLTPIMPRRTGTSTRRKPSPGGVAQDSGNGVVVATDPESLHRIDDPEVELVLWQRSLASALGEWLESSPADQLPTGRVLVDAADLPLAVAGMTDVGDTAAGAMRAALVDDVLGLAQRFMAVMRCPVVDLRLEVLHHDACWKFHRDYVAARMLTTYRGPGTEWVAQADSATALSLQRSYDGPMHRFPRHAVGLFKGNRASPSRGVVHRSPPIASAGVTRLLLCLNLPSEASPELWKPA